jgi:hypothetical protein
VNANLEGTSQGADYTYGVETAEGALSMQVAQKSI